MMILSNGKIKSMKNKKKGVKNIMKLKIGEIADLKEGRKSYDEIIKCRATEEALNIGETGKWLSVDDEILWDSRVKFENGMTLFFQKTVGGFSQRFVAFEDEDGNQYEIMDGYHGFRLNANEYFNSQTDAIIEKYGQDGYDFFNEYKEKWGQPFFVEVPDSNKKQTVEARNLVNDYYNGKRTKEEVLDMVNGAEDMEFLLDEGNHSRFNEMCNMDVTDHSLGEFVTYTRERESDVDTSKRIVSEKGNKSSTVKGDASDLEWMLGIKKDDKGAYDVYTIHKRKSKGKANRGLYLGKTDNGKGDMFRGEFVYPSNQKFERVLIDKKDRIIVQYTYEP